MEELLPRDCAYHGRSCDGWHFDNLDQPRTWGRLLEPMDELGHSMDVSLRLDNGELRVWLATDPENGHPFPVTVYVERLTDGRWVDVGYFDGDQVDPHPTGDLGEAYSLSCAAAHVWR